MNILKRSEKTKARLLINKEQRDAFVLADVDVGISFQIRAMRTQRGWTQAELAGRAGMKQSWIAKLESPYKGFSLQTLLKVASVFDVGLLVRFVPISELVKRELKLSPESLTPVSFDEDPYFRPPVHEAVAQGGFVLEGGCLVDFINPSQDQPEPLALNVKVQDRIKINESPQTTETSMGAGVGTLKSIKPKRKELKDQLFQFTMPGQGTGEEYNEAAVG